MRAAVAVASLTVCVQFNASFAQDYSSANFWVRECQDGSNGLCIGYMKGMLDTNSAFQVIAKQALFCPPKGMTLDQMRRVIVLSLEQMPQYLHESFGDVATAVMARNYPCKTSPWKK